MNKALSMAGWMKRGGLLLVASSIVLTGCQGLLLTYKGQKVRDPYRIALADGTSRSDVYQAPDLTIDYHAVRNGDELQLSGVAQYTPQISNAYTLIPNFHLSVFLTDQYGNILQDRGIITPGSEDPNAGCASARRSSCRRERRLWLLAIAAKPAAAVAAKTAVAGSHPFG